MPNPSPYTSALRLEINLGTAESPDWQSVNLNLDASISVTINSPLWNDQQSFSEEFEIPIAANPHILGNVDEIYGGSIFQRLYKHQARLWVCGIPIFTGVVDMDTEVEFEEDSVSINIVAEKKSLRERLDDDNINARDVDFYFGCLEPGKRYDGTWAQLGEDDNATVLEEQFKGRDIRNVPIGVCNAETTRMDLTFGVHFSFAGEGLNEVLTNIIDTRSLPDGLPQNQYRLTVDMPQMMFPKHYQQDSFVNATHVYAPGKDRYKYPYCNVQAAVQKYECIKGSETESSGESEWQSKRGYTLFGPERLNSSPCFFVLFWLEQLFDIYLGVDYDISPLINDSDMLALCFVNAKCKFHGEPNARGERTADGYGALKLKNSQLTLDGGISGDLATSIMGGTELPGAKIQNVGSEFAAGVVFEGTRGYYRENRLIDFHYDNRGQGYGNAYSRDASFNIYMGPDIGALKAPELTSPAARFAMATSENLPDIAAKEVIEALENAFGFKFFYDDLLNKVTVVRYNDMLHSDKVRTHSVVIESVRKRESNIRGFRLKYSASQPARKNVFTHREERVQGGDDTTFNYNDYRYVRHIQNGNVSDDYVNVIKALGCYDETLFVSDLTGNAYRIKVDQDASDESKWYPSLFEVGGFRDVEYGDCSDDELVKEISIGFKPFIPNDTSFERQKVLMKDSEAVGADSPCYSMFLDGEHHQPKNQGQMSLSKYMTEQWSWDVMDLLADKTLITLRKPRPSKYLPQVNPDDLDYLQANFNFYLPQGCDEGDINANPMNSIDMGFMLGFLRKTGETFYERYTATRANYDGEGNYILQTNGEVGNGTLSADNIDTYGNVIGDISLKLKAEKPVEGDTKPYDTLGKVDYRSGNTRYYPVADKYARRGLFDRYWRDYAYFITHCKVALIEIPRDGIGISDLTSIDLTVPHRFGDYTGFIQSYSYSVDAYGIASVSIELAYC